MQDSSGLGAAGHSASHAGVGLERDPVRSAAEFGRAQRHSRTVRWLRIGLPLVALAIVAGALGVTWAARSLPADLSVASTTIEDGRLVMADPRLSGVDGNNRPYSMLATRAIQSLGGSGVDLETVRASLTLDAETTAELTAAKGRFDTKTNLLRLYDDIAVDTSSGISVRLSSADVDLAEGRMTGAGPVEIRTANQRLEAGAVSISENGRRVSFTNRVRLTLLPETAATGAEPPFNEPTP